MALRRWRLDAPAWTVVGLGLAISGCADQSDIDPDGDGGEAVGGEEAPSVSHGAPIFGAGGPSELALARSISFDALEQRLEAGRSVSIDDLVVTRQFVDDLRMAHTRVQQTVGGVPVFGGEAIVHLNPDGKLFAITDNLVRNIQVDARPSIDSDDAIDLAVDANGCRGCLTAPPVADLYVLRHEGRDYLTWRVQLRREDGTEHTAMPVFFIDAHTGSTVWSYDNLQTGTGPSLYSGTVTINTYKSGSTYYMEDLTRKVGTFDNRNTSSSTYRFTDTNDVWDSSSQRAGVDAHWGAGMVYDYFKNMHGRNGIDGNGGPAYYTAADGATGLISSKVHYSSRYNNAFWNGSYMTYGDGDGSTFSSLVSVDIAGHEMTHGVTQYTANLTYSGESGALNESVSDVFGAMVERYAKGESANTWKIGEEVYTPSTSGDALRYMDNPHGASNYGYTSDDDPDHYSERYTGSSDNGGVHINSGISNKVFYLLAAGGSHHLGGSMTGIGADAAASIWYRALTAYMTASTNFAGARTATLNAAAAIYGSSSTQYTAVATAWGLCGVGTVPGDPTPTPTPTPTPAPGNDLIDNGELEGTSAPWVLSGNAYYTANGSTPHGGTGYAYLGNVNYASGTLYQQVTIPSTATTANLSFWLNVATQESTTSTQYDKLYVEVRSSSGTLLATMATYSNLNASSSYAQKTLNLIAYKGQTIRVQFRATTDSYFYTIFRVDDVSLQ